MPTIFLVYYLEENNGKPNNTQINLAKVYILKRWIMYIPSGVFFFAFLLYMQNKVIFYICILYKYVNYYVSPLSAGS